MVKIGDKLFMMFFMDVKFGKIRPNSKNLFAEPVLNGSSENFFASHPDQNSNNKKPETPSNGTRINDYDSKILEDNAYQVMTDEIFKLEYKMSVLEDNLLKINNEISTMEGLGYDIQIYDLKSRRQKLEDELKELNKKYSDLCLSSKISGKISSVVRTASNGKGNGFSKIKDFISKKILAKLSKKINYTQVMREALDNLSNINSSVDELIQMQTPYGETVKRYEKLTACLNKANIIHSQIIKNTNAKIEKNLKP